MRMAQSGVAGKMVGHRGDADRHLGGVDANRSRVRYVATVRQARRTDLLIQFLVTLMHERARRPYFQIRFGDLPVHDLTFVELRRRGKCRALSLPV